jgi:hypothetical protein
MLLPMATTPTGPESDSNACWVSVWLDPRELTISLSAFRVNCHWIGISLRAYRGA